MIEITFLAPDRAFDESKRQQNACGANSRRYAGARLRRVQKDDSDLKSVPLDPPEGRLLPWHELG